MCHGCLSEKDSLSKWWRGRGRGKERQTSNGQKTSKWDSKHEGKGGKEKKVLPDKQTVVYWNECSRRPVVCSNHCYLLILGCPFVSFQLLPGSSPLIHLPFLSSLVNPLFFRFAWFLLILLFSHLLSSWKFQDDIGAAYSLVPSFTELHIWPDRHSYSHTHTRMIQTHINIQGQEHSDIQRHTQGQRKHGQIRWMTSDMSG